MRGFGDIPDQPPSEPSEQAGQSAVLSRRKLLTGMGTAAACLGLPQLAHAELSHRAAGALQASNAAPVPIPGGFSAQQAFGPRFPNRFFHLFLPGPGTEPSTIFNFQGKMAILNIHGTGIRSEFDPETGELTDQSFNLPFATDVRFMQGTYVGIDGQQHQGTFAFF